MKTKQTKVNKGVIKKPPKIEGTNKYDIDENQIEFLASKFWTNTEIAAFLGVTEGTIRKGYSEILIKGRENGKAKLRDLQLKAAQSGNVTMLIWLGKQYLGQSDKQDLNLPKIEGIKFVNPD
jgi:hypothetical protein